MKKSLGLLALLVGTAIPSHGMMYNDYDIFDGDGISIKGKGGSHTGTFDIVNWDGGIFDNVGFNPTDETIVSAVGRFALGAAGFGTRYYDINIGSDDFASGEFGVFFLGGASESGDLTGSALLSLSSTGAVDYTITNTSKKRKHRLSLLWAKLDVKTRKGGGSPIRVPDSGSSLTLLGLGLIGIFFARRRAAK